MINRRALNKERARPPGRTEHAARLRQPKGAGGDFREPEVAAYLKGLHEKMGNNEIANRGNRQRVEGCREMGWGVSSKDPSLKNKQDFLRPAEMKGGGDKKHGTSDNADGPCRGKGGRYGS